MTTPAQLKRAAGSQSLSDLQDALSGWTADQINHQDGKSALHVAAWKGCLENVVYLIETVGCDVNAYSTGEFNYGKTAIFYAATQSRVNVVEYLLNKAGAKVAIVNNKGQSVLSLCATHEMPNSILETIQALEEQDGDWWNFRATHSDGLEYGDLDPRFWSHDDVATATDVVVTKYAVNPTCKKTRKGGFARRNPEQYKALTTRKQGPKKLKNQQKRRQAAELTLEEKQQLENAWNHLEDCSFTTVHDDDVWEQHESAITTIITLNDKQFQPWIPEAADKLLQIVECGKSCTRDQIIALLDHVGRRKDRRFSSLVQKLQTRFQKNNDAEEQPCCSDKIQAPSESTLSQSQTINIDWKSEPWGLARNQVQHLSMSLLEDDKNSKILKLPQSPSFVNTKEELVELQKRLQNTPIIALDTEWRDMGDTVAVSTLQVALLGDCDEKHQSICTYVVDLVVDDDDMTRSLVKSIFSSNAVLLGFAFRNDMPLLEAFTGTSLSQHYFLDVQQLFFADNITRGQLPGLSTCAAKFSNVPLSKDLQCSEWGERPLSEAQLEYAGLDAAILLILLAERSRLEQPLVKLT